MNFCTLFNMAALQPFSPCLPIRGGKLKSAKHFSSSNPHLPFSCSSISTYLGHHHNTPQPHNFSTNSINSSVIWREASPNNFNFNSTSINSLSPSQLKYRSNDMRAASEERPPSFNTLNNLNKPFDNNSNSSKLCSGNLKKIASNYDNINSGPSSPLTMRKSGQVKFWSKLSPSPSTANKQSSQQLRFKQYNTIASNKQEKSAFLYDKRLNKSFETANGLIHENSHYTNYNVDEQNLKNRRSSTPQLNGNDVNILDEAARNSVNSTWCCGNFVLKQWKKMNQY